MTASDVRSPDRRNPATDPRPGDCWTRGSGFFLRITEIDPDGRVTITPSGPGVAPVPRTWTRARWPGSVCAWPGWTFTAVVGGTP